MQSLHSHLLTFKQTCPPLSFTCMLHDGNRRASEGQPFLWLDSSAEERVFHNELHDVCTCLLSCCCRRLLLLSLLSTSPAMHSVPRLCGRIPLSPLLPSILSRCACEGRRDQILPSSCRFPRLPSLNSNPICLILCFPLLGTFHTRNTGPFTCADSCTHKRFPIFAYRTPKQMAQKHVAHTSSLKWDDDKRKRDPIVGIIRLLQSAAESVPVVWRQFVRISADVTPAAIPAQPPAQRVQTLVFDLWRPRLRKALWRVQLRGVQRLLQKDCPKRPDVCLS